MDYYEAFEMIKIKLRHSCRQDVIEVANVCGDTYDRWSNGLVIKPSLATFVKFCIYYELEVGVADLKELLT